MRQITSSLQIERGLSGEEERGGKEDIKARREGGKGFGGEFIRSLKSRGICPFFPLTFLTASPPPTSSNLNLNTCFWSKSKIIGLIRCFFKLTFALYWKSSSLRWKLTYLLELLRHYLMRAYDSYVRMLFRSKRKSVSWKKDLKHYLTQLAKMKAFIT